MPLKSSKYEIHIYINDMDFITFILLIILSHLYLFYLGNTILLIYSFVN